MPRNGCAVSKNGREMSRMGKNYTASRLAVALLGGTVLGGMPAAVMAQTDAAAEPAAAPAVQPAVETIQSISVVGAQRLETQTILSYIQLRQGQV